MKTGAQEHFYMETQATLAIPRENKEMELFGKPFSLSRRKKEGSLRQRQIFREIWFKISVADMLVKDTPQV